MPWGIHYGVPLDDLKPAFMNSLLNGNAPLPAWLRAELKERLGLVRPVAVGPSIEINSLRGLLKRWYFALSKQLHPDHGGHAEQMQAVSVAYTLLREELGKWEASQ